MMCWGVVGTPHLRRHQKAGRKRGGFFCWVRKTDIAIPASRLHVRGSGFVFPSFRRSLMEFFFSCCRGNPGIVRSKTYSPAVIAGAFEHFCFCVLSLYSTMATPGQTHSIGLRETPKYILKSLTLLRLLLFVFVANDIP